MSITRPTAMNVLDWADQVNFELDAFGPLVGLENELMWQEWAIQFLNNSKIAKSLPNPYEFSDWQEWAERFCGVLG